MITKENPVQTCVINRHKVHETSIKLIPLSTKTLYILIPTCIKNRRKCHICIKTQGEKVSRTGINGQNIAQMSKNLPNGKYIAAQQLYGILYKIPEMYSMGNKPNGELLCFHLKSNIRSLKNSQNVLNRFMSFG